jgi:heme exporter protein D
MIQFENFQDFIAMGGYAANVWSVYAMFAVFLAFNLLWPLRKKKQLMREIKRRQIVNEQAHKQAEPETPVMQPLEPLADAASPAGDKS